MKVSASWGWTDLANFHEEGKGRRRKVEARDGPDDSGEVAGIAILVAQ